MGKEKTYVLIAGFIGWDELSMPESITGPELKKKSTKYDPYSEVMNDLEYRVKDCGSDVYYNSDDAIPEDADLSEEEETKFFDFADEYIGDKLDNKKVKIVDVDFQPYEEHGSNYSGYDFEARINITWEEIWKAYQKKLAAKED